MYVHVSMKILIFFRFADAEKSLVKYTEQNMKVYMQDIIDPSTCVDTKGERKWPKLGVVLYMQGPVVIPWDTLHSPQAAHAHLYTKTINIQDQEQDWCRGTGSPVPIPSFTTLHNESVCVCAILKSWE